MSKKSFHRYAAYLAALSLTRLETAFVLRRAELELDIHLTPAEMHSYAVPTFGDIEAAILAARAAEPGLQITRGDVLRAVNRPVQEIVDAIRRRGIVAAAPPPAPPPANHPIVYVAPPPPVERASSPPPPPAERASLPPLPVIEIASPPPAPPVKRASLPPLPVIEIASPPPAPRSTSRKRSRSRSRERDEPSTPARAGGRSRRAPARYGEFVSVDTIE